jgi:hypothetical protein
MSIEKQFVTFTLTCPGAKAQRQVFFSLTSRAIWLSFFACLHFRKLLLFEGNLTNGQHLPHRWGVTSGKLGIGEV